MTYYEMCASVMLFAATIIALYAHGMYAEAFTLLGLFVV